MHFTIFSRRKTKIEKKMVMQKCEIIVNDKGGKFVEKIPYRFWSKREFGVNAGNVEMAENDDRIKKSSLEIRENCWNGFACPYGSKTKKIDIQTQCYHADHLPIGHKIINLPRKAGMVALKKKKLHQLNSLFLCIYTHHDNRATC